MAGLLNFSNPIFRRLSLSDPAPLRASLRPSHVALPPTFVLSGDLTCWKIRTIRFSVVTQAGASTSSYVLAFALALSLIIITVLTSIRVADKLDRDFLD